MHAWRIMHGVPFTRKEEIILEDLFHAFLESLIKYYFSMFSDFSNLGFNFSKQPHTKVK